MTTSPTGGDLPHAVKLGVEVFSKPNDWLRGPKGPGELAFLKWWLEDDIERAKCTMLQALGSYLQSFPGRVLGLLHELLKHNEP